MFEENWDAVQVFKQCQPSYLQVGLATVVYLGIAAVEIEAAARLCRISPDDYDTVRGGCARDGDHHGGDQELRR